MKRINTNTILLALTLLITSCGKKQAGLGSNMSSQAYPTIVTAKQNVTLEAVYPITIKGKEDVEIRPRIDGFIDAIYVDEGSVVRAGQVLFKINSPQAEQTLTTAQASVSSAEAQVSTARLNVERIRPLAEKGIVSAVQLETYQNAYSSAQATLEQAVAALKNAKAMIGWTQVSSPVNGVVGAVAYRQGSLVSSQNVLTTVANTSKVFACFSLNEKMLTDFLNRLEGDTQAEKIRNAPPITLTLADGTVYPNKGKLETITGVLNVATGSANFRVEFPNERGQLRSGASGKISIPRVMDNVLLIPQKATFAQQDKVLVYKVQGDSVVQKIITVIPTPDSKGYVVTGGLNENDRIVTDGIGALSNGKKIAIQ